MVFLADLTNWVLDNCCVFRAIYFENKIAIVSYSYVRSRRSRGVCPARGTVRRRRCRLDLA